MPRCSWQTMNAQSPDAHLIVAMLPAVPLPAQPPGSRPAIDLLCDFIVALGIKGSYAVTESEGRGGARVHCAFGDELDAERFANPLLARWTPPDRWASRSTFDLDPSAVSAIEATLAGSH